MDIALLSIRIFLFTIFALAAIGKLLDLRATEKAVAAFGVPGRLSGLTARFLPVTELVIAFMFLQIQVSWWGAVAATLLLGIFTLAMLWQLSKGNKVDCHCFGQIQGERINGKIVLRNLVLLALSGLLIAMGNANQGHDIFGAGSPASQNFLIILGLTGVVLIVSVLFFVKQVLERQAELTDRFDRLEDLFERRADDHPGITDPGSGLPIGAPVPDFSVLSLDGSKTNSDNLFGTDKPTLLMILGPECAPCEALMPEMRDWMSELDEKVSFVFLSSGDSKSNLTKFESLGRERLLLQRDKEVSRLLSAMWTPTAILIGADKRIASRPAAGDIAIRELVEHIRNADLTNDEPLVFGGNSHMVGEVAPDFRLEDLDGKVIGKGQFENFDETVVVHWSTDCVYCVNLLDDFREWDREERKDDLGLLVISSGEIGQNRKLGLSSTVVIDNEDSLAAQFGIPGTPSAIRVDRAGKFTSEPAVGARDLWSLIGR